MTQPRTAGPLPGRSLRAPVLWGVVFGVIAVEAAIAAVFVVVAAAGVSGPAWLLVAGLAGHGFKDLWQHRSHYVANTRWWPPFCLVVDWVVAAILVVLIAAGVDFHH
jgi:hypothetical protein